MSDKRTDILEHLAPTLAPESTSNRENTLVGVWSYRDDELERLVWRGDDERSEGVESAIETAVWLFDERVDEGDRAHVDTDRGTAVLERGSRGVVAAWYAHRRGDDSSTISEAESSPAKTDASPSHPPGAHTPQEPARRTEEARSINIDLSTSEPPVDRTGAASREGRSSPPRRPKEASERSGGAPSSRHARPSNIPDADPPDPPDTGSSSTEFEVQISFADTSSTEAPASSSSPETTRSKQSCRWRMVVAHFDTLTERASEHLGRPVLMHYWDEVIEPRSSIADRLDIHPYEGFQTDTPETTIDDTVADTLDAARREWLRRCRRNLPSHAELVDDDDAPPWHRGGA